MEQEAKRLMLEIARLPGTASAGALISRPSCAADSAMGRNHLILAHFHLMHPDACGALLYMHRRNNKPHPVIQWLQTSGYHQREPSQFIEGRLVTRAIDGTLVLNQLSFRHATTSVCPIR